MDAVITQAVIRVVVVFTPLAALWLDPPIIPVVRRVVVGSLVFITSPVG